MPKQVYIYGDSLLKATMPDEGYHYHFHYDEVLQRYPERRTQAATTATTIGQPSMPTRRGIIVPGRSCLPFGRSSATR